MRKSTLPLPEKSSEAETVPRLDALASILPVERREALATLLTDEDVATLKHLVETGMGANTLRALASDLAYLEAWARAATGAPLPWPVPEALVLKFLAHHLWDPVKRESDPEHGMPEAVALALRSSGQLRVEGPHAPATVERRLASWRTLHRWRGLEGPFTSPTLRSAWRLAVRANPRPRQRKSARAVTKDVLTELLKTCHGGKLVDLRDRALLLMAFASGGRRRSEMAGLRVEQLHEEVPVPADPLDPMSPRLPCLSIQLGRTKTSDADEDARVLLVGSPVEALRAWMKVAGITKGALFRPIDRWDNIDICALTPQAVNQILKQRCAKAGLDPKLFSAHGLRSGYLTEAGRAGVSLPEAMQQSQHRSVQQAARYYNDAERWLGKAARILE